MTECNQFGGTPIDILCFERYELRRGIDVLEVVTGVVGGMSQVLEKPSGDRSFVVC